MGEIEDSFQANSYSENKDVSEEQLDRQPEK